MRKQRGAALILFATVLVLGAAWYSVSALTKMTSSSAERAIQTGVALNTAKQALLSYMVQYAAQLDASAPGMMPCPESPGSIGGPNEGEASTNCALPAIGRFPWKTVGSGNLLDGDGEPLWYALSAGFRQAPINLDSTGTLSFTDNGATATDIVAVIIAPGKALNTLSASGTPPSGCSGVNQQVSTRGMAPLAHPNFLECGNASGSYANLGMSGWSNDRAITITTAEWWNALLPVIADRLQKQVAVALRNWDADELAATGRSWGATHGLPYLPFASTWGNPTTTDYCANQGAYEGLMPIEETCVFYNNTWSGSATTTGGMSLTGCSNPGGTNYRRCRFSRQNATTPLTARITITAADVGRAFRGTISVADLTIGGLGTATMSFVMPNSTSDATGTINVTWPNSLPVGTTNIDVLIPHLQDARVLSDSRLTWYWNNLWHRFTYYSVAPAATVSSSSVCVNPGDAGCLTVSGWPAANGNTNDKRLVLVLAGKRLATQTRPSSSRSAYFESGNATSGDRTFITAATSSTFNDRVAACPHQYTPAGGSLVVVCN